MFYYLINKEIKNSYINIVGQIVLDVILIVGMLLMSPLLAILSGIYAVFSLLIIIPYYNYIDELKVIKALYRKDKKQAYQKIEGQTEELHEVISDYFDPSNPLRNDSPSFKNIVGKEKAKRRSSKFASKRYNLFVALKDVMIKEIQQETISNKNDFI